MFVKRAWYVAARSDELSDRPLYRQLLGQPVALFRDASGAPHAISALCPHRGANLGEGRVIDGALQCPMHGWRFGGDGACVRIPSQEPDAPITDKANIRAWPTQERQGLIHVWFDDLSPPSEAPPTLDYFEPSSAWSRCQVASKIYDASFLNTVENALDGAHLAFVHLDTVGHHQDPFQPDMPVTLHTGGRGFDVKAPDAPAASAQGSESQRGQRRLEAASTTDFHFLMGGLVYFELKYDDGRCHVILSFATPCDEQTTWFFAESVRNFDLDGAGDEAQRQFMTMLVDEDGAALSRLLPAARGPGGLPHPVFVRADKPTVAFRKLYGDALKAEGARTVPWADGAAGI